MGRVLIAWERGGGLGHVGPLSQLATALLDRGHEVHLAWKDLAPCGEWLQRHLGGTALKLWQAPVWLARRAPGPIAASWPEVLLGVGYDDPQALLGPALAWQRLIGTIGPDLLLADHAPTALLAARGHSTRVALFGNGFMVPPAHGPFASFVDWEPVDPGRVESAEASVLQTCNALLAQLGQPPLDGLDRLLQVDETFRLGWPELDHYAAVETGRSVPCWGWPEAPQHGAPPNWPLSGRRRIFGYLQCDHPALDRVLSQLRSASHCSLLFVSGASDAEAEAACSPHLRVVNRPVRLDAAFAEAELLLGHAGTGTLYPALQAGLPLLMLPTQAEQLVLARRVAAVGAGIFMWPHEVDEALGNALKALLESPGFAAAARRLSARNPAAGNVIDAIADRCEALMAPAGAQ